MTQTDDDELTTLRKRAYGRDADIHLDPDSLERLRELESPEASDVPLTDDEPEPVAVLLDVSKGPAPSEELAVRPTPRLVLWVLGLRRSTVLIVLGVALTAAGLGTALTLVERVQPDPLQTGANQIDRLSADSGYPVPEFFGGPTESGAEAYEEFHGLRMIVTPAGSIYSYGSGACLDIYPQMNIADSTANSFSGRIFSGCAAGAFPPIVQFASDVDGLPPEMRAAFPDSTALQFVYDKEHNEVVVFSDR